MTRLHGLHVPPVSRKSSRASTTSSTSCTRILAFLTLNPSPPPPSPNPPPLPPLVRNRLDLPTFGDLGSLGLGFRLSNLTPSSQTPILYSCTTRS